MALWVEAFRKATTILRQSLSTGTHRGRDSNMCNVPSTGSNSERQRLRQQLLLSRSM